MKLRTVLNSLIITSFMLFNVSAYSDSAPITDSVITAKVKAKIATEKDLSVFKVGVTTTEGVVSLSGTTKTAKEATEAVKLAKSVKGVKDVESHIEVK